ncbi:MAG: hypothetical protein IRZ26_08690, partial [Clostridia bacterium]|nr:hypothetical protein [Clostridia bacterium]
MVAKRRLRGDAGQATVFIAILLLLLTTMGVLFAWIAAAYRSRSALQSAADAAVLAATKEAQPAVQVRVTQDLRVWQAPRTVRQSSDPDGDGDAAADTDGDGDGTTVTVIPGSWRRTGQTRTVDLAPGFASVLLGQGGWRQAAGCEAPANPPDGTEWWFCDGWEVTDAWWGYPPGTDPYAVAMAVLQRNLGSLSDVSVLHWAVNPDGRSGRVEMEVQQALPGNGLGAVTRRATAVAVLAWSQPKTSIPR